MLYQCALTIPASTAVADLESATLKLTFGVSTRREIEFPSGCCGLVGVRVFDGPRPVIPFSRDEWLVSDDNVVVDDSPYPLTSAPYLLTLYGYNTDTVNDHTIQLRVQMREGEVDEFLRLNQFLDALRGH